MSENETCPNGPEPSKFNRRIFSRNAAMLGVGGAFAVFFGGDPVRRLLAKQGRVPLNQREMQDWIKRPGLIDNYPMDGLPQEQQDAIKQAIRDGDTQFFQSNGYSVSKDAPKAGVAEATCGYYYTDTPISCCQSRSCRCYQCNGETISCSCSYYNHNNCTWCGYGIHCCG